MQPTSPMAAARTPDAGAFLARRNLPVTVAREPPGSVADAEDVRQETWLRGIVSPAETRAALDAFQRAAETGDLQHLLDILAPDVVFLGDGGGVKQAVLRPIAGAGKVARPLATGPGRITAAASLQHGPAGTAGGGGQRAGS